jgi:acetyl-CoA acetyltransferase family protein
MDVSAQDLLATVLKGLVDRVKEKSDKFDPAEIEDVIIGCLSQVGEQAGNIGRIASLLAGIPQEASGMSLNRYCPSSLQSVNFAVMSIMTGCGDITIAGGVEHMTHYPMGADMRAAMEANYMVKMSERLTEMGVFIPMGFAAEMVAERYNLKREELDRFGLWSHQKAVKAQREGLFDDHLIPIKISKKGEPEVWATKDETPRAACLDDPEGSLAKMAQLPPRFKTDGVVTAGNSSQICDAASAVMFMSADKAEKLGLEPLCRIVSMSVSGSEPKIMLLGPIPAMHKVLNRANLTMDDIDVYEPNEAFASPVLAFCKEFGLAFDDPRINPTGGAIALGHPIGATGTLYFAEMVWELKRRKLRYGLQTLCGGGGVSVATIVERV